MFLWDLQNQIPDFSSFACCEREELGTRKWERHIKIPQYQANLQPGSMYVGCHGFPSLHVALLFLMSLKCSSKNVTNDVEGGFYFWLCVILHRQVPCSVRADCWHHFASSLVVCLFVAISFNCNLALLQWTRSNGLKNQTTQQRLKKEQTLHWSGTTTWRALRFAL